MANRQPSELHLNDDLATSAVCRTMASWILAASSNKNQAHQFRLQSSFALIGFGTVSGSLFIENDGLIIGVFVLIFLIYIGLRLDVHYLKEEIIWRETSSYLDKQAITVSKIGLSSYEKSEKKVYQPIQVYDFIQRKYAEISFHDFTTKMLRRAGFVVGISIGIFAGLRIDASYLPIWEDATTIEQERSLPPTLPMMQKLLQTPSKP